MNHIIENVNTCIKNVGYDLTLNSLIEIIIREYTNLNITIKITKKFISILETIIQFRQFGNIRLSKIMHDKSKHYFISNAIPLHQIIHSETNVFILNEMYLKLLNILIKENILFDYDQIYIENRFRIIRELNEITDPYITAHLQKSCKYMEKLILTHIGKINEIPMNHTINSNCTIGELVDFYLLSC